MRWICSTNTIIKEKLAPEEGFTVLVWTQVRCKRNISGNNAKHHCFIPPDTPHMLAPLIPFPQGQQGFLNCSPDKRPGRKLSPTQQCGQQWSNGLTCIRVLKHKAALPRRPAQGRRKKSPAHQSHLRFVAAVTRNWVYWQNFAIYEKILSWFILQMPCNLVYLLPHGNRKCYNSLINLG